MSSHPLPAPVPGRILIAPSLLAADFGQLAAEVRRIEEAGADVLHLDVMDGHFVPNLTIGPALVEALRRESRLPFDVHLMVECPDRFVTSFIQAGADQVTIHVEAQSGVGATLAAIHAAGATAGLALRPQTPASALLPFLGQIELILVMTVEPGFGGQPFMEDQLAKIAEFRRAVAASGRPVHIEVDGGIGVANAARVVAAGADLLVAGTSVFRAKNGVAAAIAGLRGGV